MRPCPLSSSCGKVCASHRGLVWHWEACHRETHGPFELFVKREPAPKEACAASGSTADAPAAPTGPDLLSTAMGYIDNMTYAHAQTNAQVRRAKELASACLQALKPSIADALRPHMCPGVEAGDVVDPLLDVFESIKTRAGERNERRERTSKTHPPLRCYPRELGKRPAVAGKRKCIEGVIAYAWDTCLEEVLEREIVYDPSLLTQLILSDKYWTARAQELSGRDKYDLSRSFEDQVDGEVWQSHEVLGDPKYGGPTRIVLQAYGDDVDIPNALGPAAGHHKLWVQTVTLVNRPPRGRMTLRAQFLSSVCLSSDFKLFGAHEVISGSGTVDYSLGATCRRLWTGGVLRIPPELGISQPFRFRAFLSVFSADGMAMGDVCGTNTSFSKAINICNTCEDVDQRRPEKRKPCGFLRCRCGDAMVHQRKCACHFRLRTPRRDLARPDPTPAEMTLLGMRHGITPAIHNIPGIHVARPGPKDPMHTLNEGRTSQLAAVTLWHVVKAGWATIDELKCRASTFDWTPGSSSGFFSPNYLPSSLFTSTKVEQPDKTFVWGPHKTIKIPGSAAGVGTYVIMWTEFLRPYIPDGPLPDWLEAWRLHAIAFCMLLRYHFTFADLLQLEDLFVRSEQLVASIPAYRNLWIPKAHWVLHLAHDIFMWGPTRLLTTFLNEMKNARFKAGAKRSNFMNPAKDVAMFWVEQSDHELQTLPCMPACSSDAKDCIVSGEAASFSDSLAVSLLLRHSCVEPTTVLDFVSRVRFHGVYISRTAHVLLDRHVYIVARLILSSSVHYVFLHEIASCLSVDAFGAYYVENVPDSDGLPARLVVLSSACQLTGLWSVPVGSRLYLVPKY